MINIEDFFKDEQPPGRVTGRRDANGRVRAGVDLEGRIGIDHGALRIQPLVQPGWGREGITYGPFQRQAGLALAVSILNGHNASQADVFRPSLLSRLRQWAEGSYSVSLPERGYRWLLSPRKRNLVYHLRRWTWMSQHRHSPPQIYDNLAIGWFSGQSPADPALEGEAFLIRSAGPENGELRTRTYGEALPVLRGLQNIPVYCVILLREQGAAYYAASLGNSHGLSGYPSMRPLAIDALNDDEELYAAIFQSALGQRGFRVDTRIYGIKVMELAEYAAWYGTAQAADRLLGEGPLYNSMAEAGGTWDVPEGSFSRSPGGAVPGEGACLALLDPGQPSGLFHARLGAATRLPAEISLVWRYQDEGNYWSLSIGSEGSRLSIREEGQQEEVAAGGAPPTQNDRDSSLQILDDGDEIGIYLDGCLLFGRWFQDARLSHATRVGLHASGEAGAFAVHSIEAHPQEIPVPEALRLPFPQVRPGDREILRDEFAEGAGDLSTRAPEWQRTVGKGSFEQAGGAVRVRGSTHDPHPGRTAYTRAWRDPHFADLEVEITPPGTGRGQGEKGRSGLIFWQDRQNYLLINCWLEDAFAGGASLSSFLTLNGFEDIFDAVWTNVGTRLDWGRPFNLRSAFDGEAYTVWVNAEPVLYRALSDIYPDAVPLTIHRVGIAANWEWGSDTGSRFRHFTARGRAG